ncbi:MAG: GNAT family N-acetyltransferase [Burkholderiales bacterium]
MIVVQTGRLILRTFSERDAAFYFELWKQPKWIQYIGDKNFQTVDDAKASLLKGPMQMYTQMGFSLYAVVLKESNTPIGMCGLIKRDTLDDVDIGYGLLPAYEGKGYALEAARAVMAYAKNELRLKRVVAITTTDNKKSISLLEKIGMRYEKMVKAPNDDSSLMLFAAEV